MNISYIENEELSLRIYQACMDAGFDDCGIISIEDMDGYITNTLKRIESVPTSADFYGRAIQNTQELKTKYPWAKSIVICLSWIGKYRYPQELEGMYAKGYYVSPDSYPDAPGHLQKMTLGKWFDEQNIQWTGSTQPGGGIWGLRHAAQMAGIGIIRRNNFLYSEKGSWVEMDSFLIGEHCRLYQKKDLKPCPENCTICQNACPTGALCDAYTLNPDHCVSAINTFGKGIVPNGLHEEQLGSWMVGCDACQNACPFNRKHDWSQGEDYPGLDALVEVMQPENIHSASREQLENICLRSSNHLQAKDTEVLKINAERVLRNRSKQNKQ